MEEKKQTDIGSAYLEEIGFAPFFDKRGMKNRWEKLFGEKKAKQLHTKFKKLEGGSQEFYEFKNSDPELSKSFSEFYDMEILKNACNFIDAYQKYFGKTILEVGCDTGIMSCFLAKTFPGSRIISIDMNPSGITLAKARAEKMELNNIEFITCGLNEIEEQFDTVFSMRTMHENYADSNLSIYEPFSYQVNEFEKLTHDYAQQLTSHIHENGFLCSFERIGHDALFYAWLSELNRCGCGVLPETYAEINCTEANTQNTFQTFVSQKGKEGSPDEIKRLWFGSLIEFSNEIRKLPEFYGLAYLEEHAGALIRGIRMYDEIGLAARVAVFTDRGDPSLLYYLYCGGELGFYLQIADSSEKDKYLDEIHNNTEMGSYFGLRIEEIPFDDKNLEGIRK